MQLIINHLETIETYRKKKLETAKEIMVRNVTDMKEWVTKANTSEIKITYFNDVDFTTNFIGYLNVEKGNIIDLINDLGNENVRLL
ncbi:DNA polymerase III alpha subunit [Staphylococcus aureus]|nr:DNA polymerase III alpha subunit [Staphylococcus aureus]